MGSIILAIIVLGAGVVDHLLADRREFVWTYQYLTMHKGEAEVEIYHTQSTTERTHWSGKGVLEQQFELEVGMTDRFDFSIYQVYTQSPGSSLRFKESKLRGRYRLGQEWGDLLPILYLEYKAPQDFSYSTWEFKAIVGYLGYNITWAFNPIVERSTKSGEWEWKYAAGLGYRFYHLLTLGMEAHGSDKAHYLGPVISHGRGDLWVSLGSGWAITKPERGEPEMKLRLLLGFAVGKPAEHGKD